TRIIDPLPRHGRAVLERTHQLGRQRHVPGEEDAQARPPSGIEDTAHLRDDRLAAGDLAHDADLHVVDQKRQPTGVADVLERARNTDPKCLLHDTVSAYARVASFDRAAHAHRSPGRTGIRAAAARPAGCMTTREGRPWTA